MHPTQWLVCSGRPEGRLYSCLGPLLKVYFASVCGFYPSTSQCSGRTVPGKAWSHRQVLEGCQKFESSWDLSIFKVGLQRGPFELLDSVELKFLSRQRSRPRSLPSRGSRIFKHLQWVKSALYSGRPTLMLSWDPGLDTCPRFPPHPFAIRWWTCKHYLGGGRSSLGIAVSL